ncbi:MAG: DUF2807 domain-containing protein [Bacteroidales bacterium]|nr:DUF2807 domain-containing protein [Bacteroidales bacterium]
MKLSFLASAALALFLSIPSFASSHGSCRTDDSDTTKFVSRTLEYKDFHGIYCSGNISIIYSQGNTFSVVAKTLPDNFEHIIFDVSNNLLNVSCDKFFKSKLLLYVTTPDFHYVKASGAVKFNSGYINTSDDFYIEMSGSCKFYADSISCKDINANVSGACKFDASVSASNNASVQCNGAVKSNVIIRANEFFLEGNGAVKMEASFVGGSADVQFSGASKLNLTVDCQSLKARNNGAGKLIIKGVADKTDIKSNGVVKIDSHELNNF